MFRALAFTVVILLLIDGVLLYFSQGTDSFAIFLYIGGLLLFFVWVIFGMLMLWGVMKLLSHVPYTTESEAHEITETLDTYRYPKIWSKISAYGTLIPVIAVLLAILTGKPDQHYTTIGIVSGVIGFISMVSFFLLIAVYLRRFYVTVGANSITWGTFVSHSIAFRDIGKIVLRKPSVLAKNGPIFSIYDRNGKKVLAIGNSLYDFYNFVDAVRTYAEPFNIIYISH